MERSPARPVSLDHRPSSFLFDVSMLMTAHPWKPETHVGTWTSFTVGQACPHENSAAAKELSR